MLDSEVQKIAHDDDFLTKLISVHIAYDTVKAHIQQFHQLVSVEPEVLTNVVPHPANEMVLLCYTYVKISKKLFCEFCLDNHAYISNINKCLTTVAHYIHSVKLCVIRS